MSRLKETLNRANSPGEFKQRLNIRGEDIGLDTASFGGTLSSTEDTVQKALDALDDLALTGADISLTTSNFGGILSATENTAQKALDIIDDIGAGDIPTSTSNFDGTLSSSDTTVQAALETLDEVVSSNLEYQTTLTASSSSSLSWTSLSSGARRLVLRCDKLRPATDNVELWLRVTQSATAQSGASDYTWICVQHQVGSGSTPAVSDSGADSEIEIVPVGLGNDASQGWTGEIVIEGPLETGHKGIRWLGGCQYATAAHFYTSGSGQFIGSTSDIDGFEVLMSSGNITSGRIDVYTEVNNTGGGGGGGSSSSSWELIERSTFSASSSESIGSTSVDPTAYDAYRLFVQITSLSADAAVQVWASADGGSTKITNTSELTGHRYNNSPNSNTIFATTGTILFEWNTVDKDATNQAATAEMSMYFPSNGKYKDVHIRNFWNDNGGPKHSIQDRYTLLNNTSDIDSFIMEPSTGTMTGVWRLEGLKI